MRVDRAVEDPVPEDGDAAVVQAAAEPEIVLVDGVVVSPERPPGHGVECDDVARRLGDDHEAVDDDRRRLDAGEGVELVDPLHPQLRHIRPVDLVERAVSLRCVVAGIHEPVLGLRGGVDEAFGRDGRPGGSDHTGRDGGGASRPARAPGG